MRWKWECRLGVRVWVLEYGNGDAIRHGGGHSDYTGDGDSNRDGHEAEDSNRMTMRTMIAMGMGIAT